MEKLIRRTALARKLGVVPATIDAWCERELHGLKKVRVGKTIFIDVSEFEKEIKMPPDEVSSGSASA